MRVLFSPAIALMGRLSYTKKFVLFWLVSSLAIAATLYNLRAHLNNTIQPSLRELQGITLIEPISQAVQLIQRHRVLSSVLSCGSEAMRDRCTANKREVAEAFNTVERKLPSHLSSGTDWQGIKANWEHLRKEKANLLVADDFAAHTRLIDQVLLFEAVIADEYMLTMDSEISTFYLIDTTINRLPDALEHLGQVRAYGTGILAKGQITEQQKLNMHRIIAQLDDGLRLLKINFEKAGRHNPGIKNALSATSNAIADSAQQIVGVVETDILTGRFAKHPEDFMMMATKAIDMCYAQMHEFMLPTAEALIKERVAKAERVLYLSIGIAILLFLIAAYFVIGIYYVITDSVRSLSHSAHAFASGDMRTRVNLGTRDELSQIGDSLNEMADGFSAMLAARKRAERLLAKESHKNKTLLRMASDGIHILDLDGNVVQVNDAFCRMLGYAKAEMLTMNAAQWDAQWTAAQIKANIDALAGNKAAMLETRHRRRDGSIIDVEVGIVKVDVDRQTLVYCSSRDVTERKQAEQALIESRQRFHAVIETALDAMVQMDAEGAIIGWNAQAEKIFGWTREEAVGRMLHETIIPPQYREMHVNGLKRFLASGEGVFLNSRIEIIGLHRDGHEFPVELAITLIKIADKYEFSGFIHDITNRKQAEENIHRLAFYDSLTSLPNRRLLLDRLQHALATCARSGRHGAIMFIDLDNFKVFNDTKGHKFGDLLLIEVAQRLQSCVREVDTVARIGGDEFVVMLEDLRSEAEHAAAQTEEVGEKILTVLNRPYLIKEHEFRCTASIGTNLFIGRGSSADELLKYADIAMSQAKNAGRNAIRFFDPKMQAVLEARAILEADLHQALAGQQFRLYYQAQVDGAGRILGAEALVRWVHPQRGMVPPFQFIPLAEESSLILDIGQWVLETACRQLASWGNDEQKCGLVLAVNVSARQFKLKDFVDRVAAVIQEHRINPSRLKLELTESMVLDDLADIVAKMHALKALGVGLSMDDFGTGYSSLSYLKQLPLDQLKIDRSFINDIVTEPSDAVMVRTIIDMAHNFGLNVIAEGVETEAQLNFLKQHGCMTYQGYLFSKPVPIEEFEALLPIPLPGSGRSRRTAPRPFLDIRGQHIAASKPRADVKDSKDKNSAPQLGLKS